MQSDVIQPLSSTSSKKQKRVDYDEGKDMIINTANSIKIIEYEILIDKDPCDIDVIQIGNQIHNMFSGKMFIMEDMPDTILIKLLNWIHFIFSKRAIKGVKFCTTYHICNSLIENFKEKSLKSPINEKADPYEKIIIDIIEINSLTDDQCEDKLANLLDSIHDKLHTLTIDKNKADIYYITYILSTLLNKCLLNLNVLHKSCIITHIISFIIGLLK